MKNFELHYNQFKSVLPVNTELTYSEGNMNLCIKFYIPNLTDVLAAYLVRKAKEIFGCHFKHVWKGGNNVTFTIEKHVRFKKLTAELITLETNRQFSSPSKN